MSKRGRPPFWGDSNPVKKVQQSAVVAKKKKKGNRVVLSRNRSLPVSGRAGLATAVLLHVRLVVGCGVGDGDADQFAVKTPSLTPPQDKVSPFFSHIWNWFAKAAHFLFPGSCFANAFCKSSLVFEWVVTARTGGCGARPSIVWALIDQSRKSVVWQRSNQRRR